VILAVDSSALVLLINPDASPPRDPATGQALQHTRERVEHFLARLSPQDTIIIPAPVLAEILVQAGEGGPELSAKLRNLARVKTRPFDDKAAIETAMMTREAIERGNKRGGSDAPWQKVKVDRQVIAVARVENATRLYADDHNLVAFARDLGMDVFSTWDLPVPEQPRNLFTVSGVSETSD
jgi:predicted nucleic acid-binding protein